MIEIWKSVTGFEGHYEVSNCGRIKSLARQGMCRWISERILKTDETYDGHLLVTLRLKGNRTRRSVHKVVLEAFVGKCPAGQECRHLNGIADDNRLENLAWGTPRENKEDMRRHGTMPIGETLGMSKLTKKQVIHIRRILDKTNHFQKEIAEMFDVTPGCISAIKLRKVWKHT